MPFEVRKWNINSVTKLEYMELTIRQIKEKREEMEKQVKKLINDFHDETEIMVNGTVSYGHTTKDEQYINFKYSNPF